MQSGEKVTTTRLNSLAMSSGLLKGGVEKILSASTVIRCQFTECAILITDGFHQVTAAIKCDYQHCDLPLHQQSHSRFERARSPPRQRTRGRIIHPWSHLSFTSRSEHYYSRLAQALRFPARQVESNIFFSHFQTKHHDLCAGPATALLHVYCARLHMRSSITG